MRPSLVLSPYMRCIKTDGGFAVDDGLRGKFDLEPAMQAVVRALWSPPLTARVVGELYTTYGRDVIAAATEFLIAQNLVFESRLACDAFVDAILEAEKGDVPFLDQVELTNICPFRCQFCPRGVAGKMKRPTGKMDFALFERLLDQAHPYQARWRALELHHLGESLLHADLDRFIAAAARRGFPAEMSCNPSLLLPDLGKRMLDAGIRRLVISIDGIDDETSIAVRGPAARYDKAEKNLEALLAHASTMPSPPAIVVQMIDLRRNAHQHDGFVKRWGSTGLSFVEAYVKDLDGPDPDTGISSKSPPSYMCSYPWRSVVVLWDGRVVPCCLDSNAALVLGDLNTMSLAEIWNAPPVRRLREQLKTRTVPCGHLCDGCGWRREKYAELMPLRHPDKAVKSEPRHW